MTPLILTAAPRSLELSLDFLPIKIFVCDSMYGCTFDFFYISLSLYDSNESVFTFEFEVFG